MLNDIIALLVFRLLFSNLFRILNGSKLQLFVPLQRKTEKWRGNKKYRVIAFTIFVFTAAIISAIFNFNFVGFGIIAGFMLSLENMIFGPRSSM